MKKQIIYEKHIFDILCAFFFFFFFKILNFFPYKRKHPALRVLQAETRLTVYRLLAIGPPGVNGRKRKNDEEK